MGIPDYTNLSKSFFSDHSHEYDLAKADECGRYTEAFVKYAQGIDPKIQHLKKTGGTQYNGHAIDAIIYPTGENGIYHSVDLIGSAEQPHPWVSEGGSNPNPTGQWNEYMGHNYSAADIWVAGNNTSNMVPWVPYDEHSFNDRVQKQLAYDYGRRPQNADFQVSVWSARVFHSAYMGPEKTPLGFDKALQKHRPEWCAVLGVTVDNEWF
jgi:hypothetical protein